MKKLLVLTSTFPKNKQDPTPPFVFELSKRLAEKFDTFVLAPYSKESLSSETWEKLKIRRFKYWFPAKTNLADMAILPNLKKNKILYLQLLPFTLMFFIALVKLAKKEKISMLHAHWILAQGLLAVIYKKIFDKKIKILITIHGADIFGVKYLNFLKKWTLNNCDHITVVSGAIKEEVKKLKIKTNIPLEILPMGVDINLFNPNKKNLSIKNKYKITGPFLLFVGRLSEKKGVLYLIKALEQITKHHANTKLLIIGDGEQRESLEKQVSNLKLEKNIVFTGALKKETLPEYYAGADFFIGPSLITKSGDREGFGLVFAEALSSGCLTIATDLPAIRDIITDKKTGFIVPQKNSEKIAKTILHLLKNKKNLEKITTQGRSHIVKNFSWEIIARKYLNILETLSSR